MSALSAGLKVARWALKVLTRETSWALTAACRPLAPYLLLDTLPLSQLFCSVTSAVMPLNPSLVAFPEVTVYEALFLNLMLIGILILVFKTQALEALCFLMILCSTGVLNFLTITSLLMLSGLLFVEVWKLLPYSLLGVEVYLWWQLTFLQLVSEVAEASNLVLFPLIGISIVVSFLQVDLLHSLLFWVVVIAFLFSFLNGRRRTPQ